MRAAVYFPRLQVASQCSTAVNAQSYTALYCLLLMCHYATSCTPAAVPHPPWSTCRSCLPTCCTVWSSHKRLFPQCTVTIFCTSPYLQLYGNPLEYLPELSPCTQLRSLSLANVRIMADALFSRWGGCVRSFGGGKGGAAPKPAPAHYGRRPVLEVGVCAELWRGKRWVKEGFGRGIVLKIAPAHDGRCTALKVGMEPPLLPHPCDPLFFHMSIFAAPPCRWEVEVGALPYMARGHKLSPLFKLTFRRASLQHPLLAGALGTDRG